MIFNCGGLMFRGWQVMYQNGEVVREGEAEWKDIKKNQIKKLSLLFDGRSWHLCDKEGYLQKKQASMAPGISGSFQIESRSIGYYEGSTKVWYTIDEFTGIMQIKVEEV